MKASLAVALLCLLGLAIVAEAGHKGFGPALTGDQIVAHCIKKRGCAAKRFNPVCALNWASLPAKVVTGGFPNACYLECANANPALSIQWIALGTYKLPKFCEFLWLGIPECSLCTVVPKDPVVPPHKGGRKM